MAERLEEQVMEQLQDLMLEHARFRIAITPARPSSSGSDAVEFQVAMNREQSFTPLSKSASGGELSRLMLGLKCVFTRLQGIETVIFDEIDTGVSGRVALAIGRKIVTGRRHPGAVRDPSGTGRGLRGSAAARGEAG